MIKNYFKTAIRNVLKQRFYTLINIFGLTVGMTCSLLMLIYVQHELSFDQFHQNKNRIFRAALEYGGEGTITKTTVSPTAVLPVFQREFPEVISGVRTYKRSGVVKYEETIFQENNIYFADGTFFDIFSFNLLKGDKKTALKDPNSIIISESTAEKFFGKDWSNQQLLGKSIQIGTQNVYAIEGILEDMPVNSHFHADFLIPFHKLSVASREIWWSANYQTYLLLSSPDAIHSLQEKVPTLMKRELKEEFDNGGYVGYNFTALTDIHFNSEFGEELEPSSNLSYIYIFSVVALLILVIACINYMNLATARATDRAKEVGVRKVLGAYKKQLFYQFISESLLLSFIAIAISQILIYYLIPSFNTLIERNLTYNIFSIENLTFVLSTWLVVSFLAGSYPSVVLHSIVYGYSVQKKSIFRDSQ